MTADPKQKDLHSLIAHLAARAPGFAARLRAAGLRAGDIQTPSDLADLPVLHKEDLVALQAADPPFGGFLACKPGELKRVFQSPGPIYDPEARRPDYWRWSQALRAAGFISGDVVLNAFSYHLTPAGAMFEEGLWAIGCAVLPAGVGNQDQQVQALHTLKITGYVGLPSYLHSLLVRAEEKGLPLALRKAFVTAEPLPASLRAEINARGVVVRQGYGTAECGNLGYECEAEEGWHVPDEVLIEVCDLTHGRPVASGETGEIVATLFNPEYALVRFGTGDLSAWASDPCPCGRPAPRLMGWRGRAGDAVKVRGMFLHPRQLSDLMARFPEVDRWQAIITREAHKDFLTLRLSGLAAKARADLPERLVKAAREAIKFQVGVEIVEADQIPPDAAPIQDSRSWE